MIVLTDTDEINSETGGRIDVGYNSSTLSSIRLPPGGEPVQTYYFVFRVDKLMFREGGSGFRADAFYNLAANLFLQTYGYASYSLEQPVSHYAQPAPTTRPSEEDFATMRRAIRVLGETLDDPKTALVDGAGPFRAKLFMLLTRLKALLSQHTNKLEGPFTMAFGIVPGELTLKSLPEDVRLELETTIWWAISLVRDFPPPDAPDNLFFASGKKMAHWNKLSLMIRWLDLRDTEARLLHAPTVLENVPAAWAKSELYMAYNLEGTQFDQAIWTDRTIYDRTQKIRPERLAAVAMSFAAMAYGWMPPFLEDPDFRPSPTQVDTLKRRRNSLREGVAFADRLMANLLVWGQLDDEQKGGFLQVKAEFLQAMTAAKVACVNF